MPSANSVQSRFPQIVNFWVQILGVEVFITRRVPQWDWSDSPLATGCIDDPTVPSFWWDKGAPRRASSSNPNCLSNCAPEPLNPRLITVRSGTVHARALTQDEDAQVQVKTRIGQNAPGLFSATTGMKASDSGFLLGHLTSNPCSGL